MIEKVLPVYDYKARDEIDRRVHASDKGVKFQKK